MTLSIHVVYDRPDGCRIMELGQIDQLSREHPSTLWTSEPDGHSRADLWEAIEAREVVERSLVRLAADRRTDDDLARLERALAQMRAAVDREAFAAGDLAFHVALSEAAHNSLLAGRLAALHHRVQEMIALFTDATFRKGTVAALVDAHERLADAVGERDGDRAPQILSEMMARLRDEAGAVAPPHFNPSTAGRPVAQSKGEGA